MTRIDKASGLISVWCRQKSRC